ncbi:MAG: DUF5719 family protein [Actinomycetota bacterium]
MTERRRELVFGAVVLGLLVAGLGVDVAGNPVAAPEEIVESRPETFEERALFCPPSLKGSRTRLVLGTPSDASVPVTIQPTIPDPVEIPGRGVLFHSADDGGPRTVVGFGAPVAAGVITRFTGPIQGIGAARCARQASDSWYFAQGTSAIGFDERLLVYNPFPDEAVVRVTFYTDKGTISRANLSDLAVPAGRATKIKVNDFVFRRRVLGARVTAVRGRVVAWRALFSEPENRSPGVDFSIGARGPEEVWYFPEGAVGPGVVERIAVLNPSDSEATVNISLVTGQEVVQPRALSNFVVPAGTTQSLQLPGRLRGSKGKVVRASAIVRSTNGVPIVTERTVGYDAAGVNGTASTVGAPASAESWFVGPATMRADTDSVIVMNPGSDDATVSISLVREEGDAVEPAALEDIEVPAGLRVQISILEWTEGKPMSALLEASGPVVAERFSYSKKAKDVAATIGTPLTPISPE